MGKKIVILGAGESGAGAAVLGQIKGYDVFVSDMSQIKPKYKELLNNYNISWEEGTHSIEKIMDAGLVVKSPGIPEKAEIVKQLREKGIEVISEIEFASWFCTSKIIAITGSNGKTTTTTLLYELLKKAGLNVGLGGNIGDSFALQVALNQFEVYVLEISSFQLDDIKTFRPDIAILTNITPDHLDRYHYNFQEYIESKFRIVENQTTTDFFVFNNDDPVIKTQLSQTVIKSKQIPFGFEPIHTEVGAWVDNDLITMQINDKHITMRTADLGIKGKHNVYNSMAAGISAVLMDIRKDTIREALSDFKGVEHRLERVAAVRGIDFINDSKATNVNSTWYALECMHSPVVWIAGGTDKGNDYAELRQLVQKKVRAIVCIGVDNSKIIEEFAGIVTTIIEATSMEEAVKKAYLLAKMNDVVLLSPACASFDRFSNYEDRGNQFKQYVRNL